MDWRKRYQVASNATVWVLLTVIIAEGGPFLLVLSEGGWVSATKYLGNSQISLIAASIYLATLADLLTERKRPIKGWVVFFGIGCFLVSGVCSTVIDDFIDTGAPRVPLT